MIARATGDASDPSRSKPSLTWMAGCASMRVACANGRQRMDGRQNSPSELVPGSGEPHHEGLTDVNRR
jgi:hypothetical protein